MITSSDRQAQRCGRAGPRAVLVTGEAGIGKTRLVEEYLASLDPRIRVLRGRCLDIGAIGVPLAPLTSAIDDFAPDLLERVDGELPDQAIMTALERITAETPTVLVVEDLHWADPATIAMLRAIIALRISRAMIILTFRDDEIDREHDLYRTLVEWERDRLVARIAIPPLDADQVHRLATTLRGSDLTPEESPSVVRRSDGLPFFVEELVATDALHPSSGIPPTVAELLLSRYSALTPEDQMVARVLAVGGDHVWNSDSSRNASASSDSIDGRLPASELFRLSPSIIELKYSWSRSVDGGTR